MFPRTAPALARRAPHDRATRHLPFAQGLIGQLPTDASVVSLWGGIGSAVHWLADLADQPGWRYTVVDSDERLLAEVPTDLARTERRTAATLPSLPANADLVLVTAVDELAAASLPRVADWIARTGAPVLIGPTVDGTVRWLPPHELDEQVHAAVRLHQRSQGPGPQAAPWLADHLRLRAYDVQVAAAPWRLASTDRATIHELVEWTAGAASSVHPDRSTVEAWRHTRLLQARVDAVDVTVGQWDMMARPSKRASPRL